MRKKVVALLLVAIINIVPILENPIIAEAATTSKVAVSSAKKNQASNLVKIASKEIGYKEGKKDKTKYGMWYGLQNNPWCAMFVSWCANKAGISKNIIPMHSACLEGVKWFKKKGLWHGRNYVPKPGDIIYFTKSHVGIVESVTNGYVNTIEGNTSNMVARRHYKLKSPKILGYGVPKYTK